MLREADVSFPAEGGQFDAYLGGFAKASAAAIDWFKAHL
jgi:hypothetical protein